MEAGPEKQPRLPWWFWVVLFLPPALAFFVPFVAPLLIEPSHSKGGHRAMQILHVQVVFTFYVFAPLNLVCSLIAGRLYARTRPIGPSPTSTLGNAALFFFMNFVVAFAGCAVPAHIADLFRK
jgi:hypothetical protein